MKSFSGKDYACALIDEKIFIFNEKQPFTWTSGLVMPFYCDQRAILSNIVLRTKVLVGLKKLIQDIPNYKQCALVGVVSAGVPWASMLAQDLGLPLGYVRSQKKEHGKKNALEGNIIKSMPIILVEDLVSTAKSLVQAHTLMVEEGYRVVQSIALFTYNFKASRDALKAINLPLATLSNFKILNEQLDPPMQLNKDQAKLFCDLN